MVAGVENIGVQIVHGAVPIAKRILKAQPLRLRFVEGACGYACE